MAFGSGQKISGLDSHTKFQMFTLFTGCHVGGLKRLSNMAAPYYRLCNFVRNISTNISALGQRAHLKLGELSPLFIVYNITIFWLYPLHSLFYFLLRDSAHTLYMFFFTAPVKYGTVQSLLADFENSYRILWLWFFLSGGIVILLL